MTTQTTTKTEKTAKAGATTNMTIENFRELTPNEMTEITGHRFGTEGTKYQFWRLKRQLRSMVDAVMVERPADHGVADVVVS